MWEEICKHFKLHVSERLIQHLIISIAEEWCILQHLIFFISYICGVASPLRLHNIIYLVLLIYVFLLGVHDSWTYEAQSYYI